MRKNSEQKSELEKDDWLPDYFYKEKSGKPSSRPPDSDLSRLVKMQTHYLPDAKEIKRESERYEKSIRQDVREAVDSKRKIFVRGTKVNHMRQLLKSHWHQKTIDRMTPYEANFTIDQMKKFERYKKIKWVTKKQYDLLIEISKKYLAIPK